MTICYTLDVSKSDHKSFFRLLSRWHGSIWKAVMAQLALWIAVYLLISLTYRYILNESQQKAFEALAFYLNTGLDSTIPLTFMLGFFVTFVVGRWGSILNGMGYIDNSAVNFATFIRGNDTETQIVRRNLIRYMVLTQALVLRDISLQVRKRFPALETLVAGGLLTQSEMDMLEAIEDPYSRYWTPIHWCYNLLYESRIQGRIASDFFLEKITTEIQSFRHGLAALLKYDWVPIPLLYPQVIFIAVRLYFLICLISRQFITRSGASHRSEIDLWIPITTVVQFVVYVGWMKVAEALLNPLGEDDDDLECNYIIDKNLITGLTLVGEAGQKNPELKKDAFWDEDHVTPLYSLEAASRTVTPLLGSASKINLVKNRKTIVMTPHKSKLAKMNEAEQRAYTKVIDVVDHNIKFRSERRLEKDGDHGALHRIIRKHRNGKLGSEADGPGGTSLPSPLPTIAKGVASAKPRNGVGTKANEQSQKQPTRRPQSPPTYQAYGGGDNLSFDEVRHPQEAPRRTSAGNVWSRNEPSTPTYHRPHNDHYTLPSRDYYPPGNDDYEDDLSRAGLRRY